MDFSAGVHYVFDTNLASGFSILECQKEFIQRYSRKHHDSHALPMFTSSCPGNIDLRPIGMPSSSSHSRSWWQFSSVYPLLLLRLINVHTVHFHAVCWIHGEVEIAAGALERKDRTCNFNHSLYWRLIARVKNFSLSLLLTPTCSLSLSHCHPLSAEVVKNAQLCVHPLVV